MSIEIHDQRQGSLSGDANALLAWVRQCPEPSGIRVYLSPALSRRSPLLPRTLLSLGCSVTLRAEKPALS